MLAHHPWLQTRCALCTRSHDINTVGKRKQLHVLATGLISIRHDTWIIHEYYSHERFYLHTFATCQCLLMSTKLTIGFTNEYLTLVGYYSQIQKCMTVITHKYFQRIRNRSHEIYFLCRKSPTWNYVSSKFLPVQNITLVFFNLDMSCTVDKWNIWKFHRNIVAT